MLTGKGLEMSYANEILADSRIVYNNSILLQNLCTSGKCGKPKNNAGTAVKEKRPEQGSSATKPAGNISKYVDSKYIDLGRQFIKDRQYIFDQIESEYNVPAEAVTAILIIESKLGKYHEKHYVLNAYMNMASCIDTEFLDRFIEINVERYPDMDTDEFRAMAKKRGEWALREVKALIRLSNELDMDPLEFKGSYAGAIGPAQFIPSSIVNYFTDGNADGIRDPFIMEDAIASIANYLKKSGWNNNEESRKQAIWNYNHNNYYVISVLGVYKELLISSSTDEPGMQMEALTPLN
jgi:membrane-bound lytic murein transglycosylase B